MIFKAPIANRAKAKYKCKAPWKVKQSTGIGYSSADLNASSSNGSGYDQYFSHSSSDYSSSNYSLSSDDYSSSNYSSFSDYRSQSYNNGTSLRSADSQVLSEMRKYQILNIIFCVSGAIIGFGSIISFGFVSMGYWFIVTGIIGIIIGIVLYIKGDGYGDKRKCVFKDKIVKKNIM